MCCSLTIRARNLILTMFSAKYAYICGVNHRQARTAAVCRVNKIFNRSARRCRCRCRGPATDRQLIYANVCPQREFMQHTRECVECAFAPVGLPKVNFNIISLAGPECRRRIAANRACNQCRISQLTTHTHIIVNGGGGTRWVIVLFVAYIFD